jgi:uncharacterized protein (TIGR02301 family)
MRRALPGATALACAIALATPGFAQRVWQAGAPPETTTETDPNSNAVVIRIQPGPPPVAPEDGPIEAEPAPEDAPPQDADAVAVDPTAVPVEALAAAPPPARPKPAHPGVARARGSAEHRDTLQALARTMGEIHALRAACQGVSDQTWRSRMATVMDLEAPADSPLRRDLIVRFNEGWQSGASRWPSCPGDARTVEAGLARTGERLSVRMAGLYQPARP